MEFSIEGNNLGRCGGNFSPVLSVFSGRVLPEINGASDLDQAFNFPSLFFYLYDLGQVTYSVSTLQSSNDNTRVPILQVY